ncbi:MAG: RtcB family protein, partial [Spirochaetes bacterium]|nr:RtcB family protein [Spirochaetota bacterium]
MSNVKIISSAKSWIESNAVAQLEKTVQLQGVVQAVGLPDLHFGKGVPVGSAILVKDRVYPHLTGNDIGCGMAFFKTDVLINRFKADKAQKKLKSINGLISVDLED